MTRAPSPSKPTSRPASSPSALRTEIVQGVTAAGETPNRVSSRLMAATKAGVDKKTSRIMRGPILDTF